MELTILGSAAAEAIPDPFCRCRVCETARREGGREIRGRSSALLNDDLLIDPGPDLLAEVNQLRRYLGNLRVILVTHKHEDHWLTQNFLWRKSGFTPTPIAPATIYGPADALEMLDPDLAEPAQLSWQPVSGGDRWQAGPYQVTAVPATHGGGEIEALLYVIEAEGRRCFYATDTGPLGEAAWEILKSLGPMDLIVLDATAGKKSGGTGHHGMAQFLETRSRMIAEGVLVLGQTVLVAHHFSHNGGMTHREMVEAYQPYDVMVSYDGMRLRV